MQRLNYKTGKPFQRGELRYDGKKFGGYSKKIIKKTGYFVEIWLNAEDSNMSILLKDCRRTAKEKNLPFNIDLEYLRSIKVDRCPIFGTLFEWDRLGEGYNTAAVPSLDKFYPELGYVKGNVAFISQKANRIKSDATEKEMYMVADWFWEEKKRRDVKENTATPVSTRTDQQSEIYPQLGTILTPGIGQDSNNAHHHSGAVQGKDTNHSAQASSGNSVGRRNKEVGAPQTPTRIKNHGEPDAEIVRLEFGRRYLSD
jgi:hypothetical protein